MPPTPDPYLLPNGTLKNKLGMTDADELSRREAQLTAARIMLLGKNALLKAPLTFDVLKQAHRYIYQDIYDWAGQPRTCPLRKRHYDHPLSPLTTFAPPEEIEARAQRIFDDLADNGYLIGLSMEEFADGIADLFIKLNDLHPFREGNGRTQREYLRALARNAGRELVFDVVTRERMIAVSISGSQGDIGPARRLFTELLDPGRVAALRKAIDFLNGSGKVAWNDLYIATSEVGQVYQGKFVSQAGNDFMLLVDDRGRDQWIVIGESKDLPPKATSGDVLTLTARTKKT